MGSEIAVLELVNTIVRAPGCKYLSSHRGRRMETLAEPSPQHFPMVLPEVSLPGVLRWESR